VGGHFSSWQNKDGYSAAIAAVMAGADAIRAFARAGGHFTEQEDHDGMTAALWAASREDIRWPTASQKLGFPEGRGLVNTGGAAISAFYAAGGRSNDHQDRFGRTAAMLAIFNSPEAIEAFAKAGGHFTEQEDHDGRTAEMWAASQSAGTIQAFARAGGRFTDHQTKAGSSEMTVVYGSPEAITAYSEAGGIFTDRKNKLGWTSGMIASNLSEWMAVSTSQMSGRSISDQNRESWKKRFGERDVAAAKAYQEAITRQGGVRHVE
jgi:ankyrin repeat protein